MTSHAQKTASVFVDMNAALSAQRGGGRQKSEITRSTPTTRNRPNTLNTIRDSVLGSTKYVTFCFVKIAFTYM